MAPKKSTRRGECSYTKSDTRADKKRSVKEPTIGAKRFKTESKTTSELKECSDHEEDRPIPFTHWLMKSEPESRFEKGIDVKFSFGDLQSSPDKTACWDGVRNYQARNFMRDQMKVGHSVFFYHSNCKEPGIAGICEVVKESYPDHTQFDSKDPHYDRSSKTDNPKWFMVDVKYVRPLKRFISLDELKQLHQSHVKTKGPLSQMSLFTRARLSVHPIQKEEWEFILSLSLE